MPIAAEYNHHIESAQFHPSSSPVSRDRRHLDDVSTGYCSDVTDDVISSGGDVIRDVVLPTAFVRRRNERERQRVR